MKKSCIVMLLNEYVLLQGIPKAPVDPRVTRNLRVTGPPTDHRAR